MPTDKGNPMAKSTPSQPKASSGSKPVRVLSIDGGGIRGIIPGILLEEIEQRTGKPICDLFDLIAGTSTGGILALGLTKPAPSRNGSPHYSAGELVDLYLQHGSRIFSKKMLGGTLIGAVMGDEKYPSKGIDETLNAYFGETMLSEALRPLIVTSYDTYLRVPFFFKSERTKGPDGQQHDFPMRLVARATSAAPSYFEPLLLQARPGDRNVDYSLIDGGVYANNPSMCAYVEAANTFADPQAVTVVSLGTGEHTRQYRWDQVKDWSPLNWMRPALSIMMDGVADTVDYQLDSLLNRSGRPKRYFRFETSLKRASDDFDDASATNLRDLRAEAHDMIREQKDKINELVDLLNR